MAQYTGNFETGVNGNTIGIADAGSANAWNDRQTDANSAQTYSDVQKYGALSQRVVTSATPNIAYVAWGVGTLGSSLTTSYGRYYLFLPPGHDSALIPVRGFDEVTSRCFELIINAGQTVSVRDAGGTVRGTGAVALLNNQWTRLEWRLVNSPTAGQIECQLFNNPNSATPSETITSSGSFSTGNRMELIRLGQVGLGKASSTYYFDNVEVNDTGYPGPVSVPVTEVMLPMGMLGTGRV